MLIVGEVLSTECRDESEGDVQVAADGEGVGDERGRREPDYVGGGRLERDWFGVGFGVGCAGVCPVFAFGEGCGRRQSSQLSWR